MAISPLCCVFIYFIFDGKNKQKGMKAVYQISSKETGKIFIKRRKIAKALRWWLRENGITYEYSYSFGFVH